ncbi:MAG TPA: hypothetical protein VK139_00880 [Microbacteriaceae bacterium]|nr:hypothetical protein [Microbacteriaceae bacterium]
MSEYPYRKKPTESFNFDAGTTVQVGLVVIPEHLSVAVDDLREVARHLAEAQHSLTSAARFDLADATALEHHRAEQLADSLGRAIQNYSEGEARATAWDTFLADVSAFGSWLSRTVLPFGLAIQVLEEIGDRFASAFLPKEWTEDGGPLRSGQLGSHVLSTALTALFQFNFGSQHEATRRLAADVDAIDLMQGGPLAGLLGWASSDAPARVLDRWLPRRDVNAIRRNLELHAQPSEPVQPPAGLADVARRIPQGGEQVRIERYADASGPRYVVYVKGTDPEASPEQPMSVASNAPAVAGQFGESQAAVEEAMRREGIRPGDRVLFVGHSQGALVVERVANTQMYAVDGVVTFGGPLGTAHPKAPTFAIEHNEDLVPALAGQTEPSDRLVTVRTPFPEARATRDPLTAHEMSGYIATAEALDRSRQSNIREQIGLIQGFASGAGSAHLWQVKNLATGSTLGK